MRPASTLQFLAVMALTCSINCCFAQRRVLNDFPVIRQPDGISCGPSCCAMVLQYNGISAGVGPLKTSAGTRWYAGKNFNGQDIQVGMTRPSGIKNALKAYGLSASIRRNASIANVVSMIDLGRPPILLVRSGNATWHYVVAIGYSRTANSLEIALADPAGSKYWIDSRRLDSAWTFSGDLGGRRIPGRRCRACGGDGRLAKGWTDCLSCVNGLIKVGPFESDCPLCTNGKLSTNGVHCVACDGDGRETDVFRKLVESAGVCGHTLITATPTTRLQIIHFGSTTWNEIDSFQFYDWYGQRCAARVVNGTFWVQKEGASHWTKDQDSIKIKRFNEEGRDGHSFQNALLVIKNNQFHYILDGTLDWHRERYFTFHSARPNGGQGRSTIEILPGR